MFEVLRAATLEYQLCQYGGSKLQFRGPCQNTEAPFCAVLGGSETFGKFVEFPYPDCVARLIGRPVLNLGCMNAGLDAFVDDAGLLDLCRRAQVLVVQIMGAHDLSNAYYAVHPRRNDRFLRAHRSLTALFPEVDFAEFSFNRHMLMTLQQVSPERFAQVVAELQTTWVSRMERLSAHLGRPAILMWFGSHPPEVAPSVEAAGGDPLFVDPALIDQVRACFSDYVEVVVPHETPATELQGKVFHPLERGAAAQMPGPAAHDTAARALAPIVDRLMGC